MKTALEALFQAMIYDYWFTKSSGDVESPTGYFAYVTNTDREILSILDAFTEVTDVYGVPNTEDMIGSFVVVEDSQGGIHINRYDSDDQAHAAFMRLEADFLDWEDTTPVP
jgi:hypothetical protein